MAIDNLGRKHLDAQRMQQFDEALTVLIEIIAEVTVNLTDEERVKFAKIQEKRKLFANAIFDMYEVQPDLASPEVDWNEFKADYIDRKFADTRLDRVYSLVRMLSDFKIVHDFDNFQDALIDYHYSQYKSNTNSPGYTEKLNYLKQFFAKKKE